jgi:hypothetical protein
MGVFDALRHLTASNDDSGETGRRACLYPQTSQTYLYDAHITGKHHLADLYELVQYAGE